MRVVLSGSRVVFTRVVVLLVVTRRAQVERADLSSTPDVTKRYYTRRVGTRVKSGVNGRKFCPAGLEHVRHSVTVFVGAREPGEGAHKNYVSSYDRVVRVASRNILPTFRPRTPYYAVEQRGPRRR